MVNFPGSLQQVFPLTVRDEAVVKKINALMGKRVALTYEQHQGVPTSCFGETSTTPSGSGPKRRPVQKLERTPARTRLRSGRDPNGPDLEP